MRRRAAAESPSCSVDHSWMIIFSDLLTLLMTFFVLRISMASFEPVIQAKTLTRNTPQQDSKSIEQISPLTKIALLELQSAMRDEKFNEDDTSYNFNYDVKLKKQEVGSSLSLGSGAFNRSQAEINFNASVALSAFAKAIADKNTHIYIIAYASEEDLESSPEIDTWKLSAKRAEAVARQMIDTGVDKQTVSLMGYANKLSFKANPNLLDRHHKEEVIVLAMPDTPGMSGRLTKYAN